MFTLQSSKELQHNLPSLNHELKREFNEYDFSSIEKNGKNLGKIRKNFSAQHQLG